MYIWIGCKLPEDFSNALRRQCLEANEGLGLGTRQFDLPQHISLKISFPTDRATEALVWLRDFLAQQEAFFVTLEQMEQIPGVLWLKAAENPVLERLHATLDKELAARFAVAQHEFDKCFRFHSTLFQGETEENLTAVAEKLRLPLPATLLVDTFLVGCSPDGDPYGYCVTGEIPAKSAAFSCAPGETVL